MHLADSPCWLFVCAPQLGNAELLAALGCADYQHLVPPDRRYDFLAVARDAGWIHLTDNFYRHWNRPPFLRAMAGLGERFELLMFLTGDCDYSFELAYYRAGSLVRCVVWEDPDIDGGRLREAWGEPLAGEESIQRGGDALPGLWQVAAALGIQPIRDDDKFKLYV